MNKKMIYTFVVVGVLIVASVGIYFLLKDDGTAADKGFIVDYGGYKTEYSPVDLSEYENVLSALTSIYGDEVTVDTDGIITSINGVAADDSRTWSFWRLSGTDWVKLDGDPSEISTEGFTVAVCALTAAGEVPAKAVDATGKFVYGWTYGADQRDAPETVITLMPSGTEILCSIGGLDMLIGADDYSNYPDIVAERKELPDSDPNKIHVVSSYYLPASAESIFSYDPDLVIAEEVYTDLAMQLRALGVNVIVLDSGYDVDSIFWNIHITGVVAGLDDKKVETIAMIQDGIDNVLNAIEQWTITYKNVLYSPFIGTEAPFGSGPETFIGVLLDMLGSNNILEKGSWVEISTENIYGKDPDVFIVATSEFDFGGGSGDKYNDMITALPDLLKDLDADKYLICESPADVLSRAGPRIAQALELLAIVLFSNHPGHLSPGSTIGGDSSNYENILIYTKGLGFNVTA